MNVRILKKTNSCIIHAIESLNFNQKSLMICNIWLALCCCPFTNFNSFKRYLKIFLKVSIFFCFSPEHLPK